MSAERPVMGRWFEDLTPGLVIDHAITRTITEADNTLVLGDDHEPGGAAPRPVLRRDHRVRRAARQQPLHPVAADRALGVRDHPRHHGRQPRVRGDRVPRAGLPRRHHPRPAPRSSPPGESSSRPDPGHRGVRAPRLQPARRAGRPLPPLGPHEPAARHDQPAGAACSSCPATGPTWPPRHPRGTPTSSCSTSRTRCRPRSKADARDDGPRGRGASSPASCRCASGSTRPAPSGSPTTSPALPDGLTAVVVPKLETARPGRPR